MGNSTLSPFRYPGGKTWLIPYIKAWIQDLSYRPIEFAEPFAGGSAVGLMIAFENLADHVTLVEIDEDISAVWKVLLQGDAKRFANKISNFKISRKKVDEILKKKIRSVDSIAFRTILRNRINRAGIMAPGAGQLRKGENGKGIKSRWYPQTLKKRILNIAKLRNKITFIEGNGIEFIRKNLQNDRAVFFVDPPYTVGTKKVGARLYKYADIDHEELFSTLSLIQGKFILTYNNDESVKKMAGQFGFCVNTIKMRTSHHKELLELLITQSNVKGQ